jgi:hypothetical protein
MKLFVFVFTVFFMLTVTLQESLAQAATQPDEMAAFVEKFSKPDDPYFPQSGANFNGLSGSEADSADPVGEYGTPAALRTSVDRHEKLTRVQQTQTVKTVTDAIGGSKAESER